MGGVPDASVAWAGLRGPMMTGVLQVLLSGSPVGVLVGVLLLLP